MSASVGGVLEQVERPRSLFGPDYLRLAGVALVALAVHGWLIATTAVTARDSLGFARQALSFASPSSVPPHKDGRAKTTIDLVRESEHPPGYPLAVWVTHAGLRRALPDVAIPDRALLATQLTNALAAVLLVIPTYLIGRLLFGRNTGFAAALLFQVLPVPARITSDGLTEGTFLLVAVSALALGVWAVKTRRVFGFLLCGLACGASYLVRPEGLMLAVGPGAVALWLGLSRRWPRDAAAGRVAALCVGVLLVSVPYMALIGKLSNKKTTEYMNPLEGAPGPIYRGGPEGSHRAPVSAPPLGAWWNHELDAGKSRELWAFGAVYSETVKAAHYAIWPLALFGVLALRRRFAAEPALWVPVVVCAANLALLLYLAARVGYVSERHTMLITLIACQFAAAALPLLATAVGQALPFFDRIGIRVTAAGLLVCLVAGSLPFALKPLHANREGHKHAGRWLAEHLTAKDAVVDPFAWAEWYAGRTLYRSSGTNPDPSRNTYIIVEPNAKTAHSRLPVLDGAKKLAEHPTQRVVYQWPEGAPKDKVQVQIVKIGPE
jgi:hypothetical protein